MPNIIITPTPSIGESLALMREDAAFDICDNDPGAYGLDSDILNTAMGIKARKNPPKVPKMYVANKCVFDCRYCCHRCANEEKRGYLHEPDEMAKLAVEEAKRSGYGIFISSAIHQSPDYTEELIVETLRKIRFEHKYKGYVHAKIMPGADPLLIEQAGWLADRLSINIELPKCEGYLTIAPQKNRDNILGPMGNIAENIRANDNRIDKNGRRYAKSGQTTQMMVGTMHENDKTIMVLSQALYKKYNMRRVYYGSFGVPLIPTDALPEKNTPGWRSRRLYQADRLIQLYNFTSEELLPDDNLDLEIDIDPKAVWAMRHLEMFPVEVNKASYDDLIRIPGIGVTWAKRIIEARKHCTVTHDILRQMKISLKRANFFITCDGKYNGLNILEKTTDLRQQLCDTTDQLLFDDCSEIYEQDCSL